MAAREYDWLRVIADAAAAKGALSERLLSVDDSGPAERFVVRRRIESLRDVAGRQIHAIGIGRKIENGKPRDEIAVRVYVSQKLPERLIAPASRIQRDIDGIPTDVIEAAPAYFAALLACSLRRTQRHRPLQAGTSIGNASITGGTLAVKCRSTRAGENGMTLLLGNNHVLADFGLAAPGSSILQPSPQDGGGAADEVATLLRAVPVQEGAATHNRVDAAVAQLRPGITMLDGVCTVGALAGAGEASIGMTVHKHGRSSGYSVGVVDDLACDVILPISRRDPTRVARFVDQIRIRARVTNTRFAIRGDSGALVVAKADRRAVGLLFACPDDGSYAYANPLGAVLDLLDIRLA